MKNKNIVSKALIIGLLAIGGIGMVISGKFGKDSKIAVIYQDGVEIRRIDLEDVKESYEFVIQSKHEGENRIKVEKGGISIVYATCPDQVCVKAGVIRNGVLPIVCAPNHLVIEMETKEEEKLDHISY